MACAIGMLPVHGATRVWTGAQNGLWSNPANWVNGLRPRHLDSIEFPAEANVRATENDLSGLEFGKITFRGGRYTLGGNELYLNGGIVSIPGGTTNRIDCDIFLNKPQTFACYGYFNELGFSGTIKVAYPLRLETSWLIRIYGSIYDTNNLGVTQASSGLVSFGPKGKVKGTLVIQDGTLDFSSPSTNQHFSGTLVVGDDTPGTSAWVLWGTSNKIDDQTKVIVNSSGTLNLAGHSQTIGSLSGEGAVLPNSGVLTVSSRGGQAAFAGSLRGAGTFRVEGFDRGFELSGHSSFTGSVQVASQRTTNFPQTIVETHSHLILSGSASNAVVALSGESVLSGNGVAQNLTTVNAVVRPGPGTLRCLESCTLDAESRLEISLDGPEAGRLQTGQLNLANAALNVTYQGTDPASWFTLIATGSTAGSTFQGLPERAWLVVGDPAGPSEFRLTYSGNAGQDVVLERTGLFAPPVLRIRQPTPGTRVVEWPIAAQGYTLQYSPALTAAAWTTAGLPVPSVTATDFLVTESQSGDQRFYRLIR